MSDVILNICYTQNLRLLHQLGKGLSNNFTSSSSLPFLNSDLLSQLNLMLSIYLQAPFWPLISHPFLNQAVLGSLINRNTNI